MPNSEQPKPKPSLEQIRSSHTKWAYAGLGIFMASEAGSFIVDLATNPHAPIPETIVKLILKTTALIGILYTGTSLAELADTLQPHTHPDYRQNIADLKNHYSKHTHPHITPHSHMDTEIRRTTSLTPNQVRTRYHQELLQSLGEQNKKDIRKDFFKNNYRLELRRNLVKMGLSDYEIRIILKGSPFWQSPYTLAGLRTFVEHRIPIRTHGLEIQKGRSRSNAYKHLEQAIKNYPATQEEQESMKNNGSIVWI